MPTQQEKEFHLNLTEKQIREYAKEMSNLDNLTEDDIGNIVSVMDYCEEKFIYYCIMQGLKDFSQQVCDFGEKIGIAKTFIQDLTNLALFIKGLKEIMINRVVNNLESIDSKLDLILKNTQYDSEIGMRFPEEPNNIIMLKGRRVIE